ncbi:MAG: phytoene/squalene synthase family protein [Chloroflexota bacterium]|nr:phytoene/squalene synthase family protein [Chloroflexota bacterium]|tara:strand:- start:1512 stop:2525 length:1014 start_codon:yes stop_codon:yes gene_type:complete
MKKEQKNSFMGEWTPNEWGNFEESYLNDLKSSSGNSLDVAVKFSRKVLKTHSTSFFIVTRFLPKFMRDEVELVYGSVRFPDEIVDSFDIKNDEKKVLLSNWRNKYRLALESGSFEDSINKDVPILLAGFTEVVKKYSIPSSYYESFLDAMELDVEPRNFENTDDLIDNYVYGSAIVVGYFLAYVYGSSQNDNFKETLKSSKELGIALQLTNFIRDINEDLKRGRIYIPKTILKNNGIELKNYANNVNQNTTSINSARMELASIANKYYKESEKGIESFSPDSRVAIKACIELYGKLNERIISRGNDIKVRESLSWSEKLGALPSSKYWKLPMAYLKS